MAFRIDIKKMELPSGNIEVLVRKTSTIPTDWITLPGLFNNEDIYLNDGCVTLSSSLSEKLKQFAIENNLT